MDDVHVLPHIRRESGDIVFTSRIRFRMSPASAGLADRLLRSGHMQVLFEHPKSPERLVVWPLSTDTAILEMTHRGPEPEGFQLRFAHEMHAEAQVRVLSELAGFAEIVPPLDFESTQPRRVSKD
jgi:hypothetical protein